MYYFVSFDPKEGATRSQVVDAYKNFANHFQKGLPRFKLLGLFSRNVLLGSRPHYIAIWEFPDYSALDEWNRRFTEDKRGRKLAKALGNLATDWEAKVMSKLI